MLAKRRTSTTTVLCLLWLFKDRTSSFYFEMTWFRYCSSSALNSMNIQKNQIHVLVYLNVYINIFIISPVAFVWKWIISWLNISNNIEGRVKKVAFNIHGLVIRSHFPRIRQFVFSDYNSFPRIRQSVLSDCELQFERTNQ